MQDWSDGESAWLKSSVDGVKMGEKDASPETIDIICDLPFRNASQLRPSRRSLVIADRHGALLYRTHDESDTATYLT